MLRFTVDSAFNLEIDYKVIMFEPFKVIVKLDKSRNKKRARQLLTYIYLREDISINNPFSKLSYKERIASAERIIFTGANPKFTKKEQELVLLAIDTYVKYSATPEERLLSTIDEKIEENNKVLMDLKIGDKNYSKITKDTQSNLSGFFKQKKEIMDNLKHNNGKVRADQKTSLIESGAFLSIKSETGK